MVPMNNPKTWVPYMNRDCSQGFCSLYCPQWCYIIFPPPPPFEFPEDNSAPSFSPLVIAIIGILASAFLLVSYYAIMSKYCGNRNGSRRRTGENHDHEAESDSGENQDRPIHEAWQGSGANTGLDEALIKSITAFKYNKGDDGVVINGSDCSVCLSEFQDDETLRLLPKCSHAFHLSCIDTWLKSHSNCPLCRSNIVFLNPSPVLDTFESSTPESPAQNEEQEQETQHSITIREEENQETIRRRSMSMDFSCQGRLSIADILRIDHEDDDCEIGGRINGIAESSKQLPEEVEISHSHRNSVLSCVRNPAVMNRSFSSGRFLFPKINRGPNTILPS